MNLSRHLAGGVVAFLLGDLPQLAAAISTLTIVLTAALMGCAYLLRKRSPT